MAKNKLFVNVGTILHIIIDTSDHHTKSLIMRLDPQHIGLDTLNVDLYALWPRYVKTYILQ